VDRGSFGRVVVLAFALARFADGATAAAGTVWIVDRTGSAAWVAGLITARLLPLAMFSPLVVTVAHARDHRAIIGMSSGISLMTTALLAVTTAGGTLTPVLAVLLVGVGASAGALVKPAAGRLLAETVREDRIPQAALNFTRVEHGSQLVAPVVISGVLLGAGLTAAFWVAAGASAAVLLISLTLPRAVAAPGALAGSALSRLISGARVVLGVRESRSLIAIRMLARFAFGAVGVLVAILPGRIGATSHAIPVFQGLLGAGALVTIAALPLLRDRAGTGVVEACMTVLAGALVLVGFARGWPAVAVALALIGAVDFLLHAVTSAAVQRSVPRAAASTATGVADSLTAAGLLAGGLTVPGLVHAVGFRPTCVIVAVAIGAGLVVATPRLIRLSGDVRERRRTAQPVVTALRASDTLGRLSPDVLLTLAESCERVTITRGQLVLSEGAAPDAVYVIEHGRFGVHVLGHDATRVGRIDSLTPGQLFGEIGVLAARPRVASVVAESDGLLLRIPADAFAASLTADLAVAADVGAVVTQRLGASRGSGAGEDPLP
jgi:hypothetical protein